MSVPPVRRWIAALGLLVVATAPAAPLEVARLRPPAWLEADGARAPLAAGIAIAPRQRIVVGEDARVELALADGSTVKLGAATRFTVDSLAPAGSDGVFRAAFEILQGAFRFTTGALAASTRREVAARVGTVTIGIRGTDVWGRASPTRDFVVLIEGLVELVRGTERVTLSEPLSLFNAPQGQPADPLRAVEAAELSGYAAETETPAGTGVIGREGAWQIELGTFRFERFATILVDALRGEGYAVERRPADGTPQRWQVVLQGFVTRADADAIAARLGGRYPALHPRAMPRG